MLTIRRYFASAMAWQLFLLFVVPIAIAIGVEPLRMAFVLSAVAVLCWFWTIALECNQRLEPALQKSVLPVTLACLFVIVYLALFLFVFVPQAMVRGAMPVFVAPLHGLMMAAWFYSLWFVSRQFTALREKRAVEFMDAIVPFLMLWFFPLGVWYLQPQVQTLLKDDQRQLAEGSGE